MARRRILIYSKVLKVSIFTTATILLLVILSENFPFFHKTVVNVSEHSNTNNGELITNSNIITGNKKTQASQDFNLNGLKILIENIPEDKFSAKERYDFINNYINEMRETQRIDIAITILEFGLDTDEKHIRFFGDNHSEQDLDKLILLYKRITDNRKIAKISKYITHCNSRLHEEADKPLSESTISNLINSLGDVSVEKKSRLLSDFINENSSSNPDFMVKFASELPENAIITPKDRYSISQRFGYVCPRLAVNIFRSPLFSNDEKNVNLFFYAWTLSNCSDLSSWIQESPASNQRDVAILNLLSSIKNQTIKLEEITQKSTDDLIDKIYNPVYKKYATENLKSP